jgi:hypothetical protein
VARESLLALKIWIKSAFKHIIAAAITAWEDFVPCVIFLLSLCDEIGGADLTTQYKPERSQEGQRR